MILVHIGLQSELDFELQVEANLMDLLQTVSDEKVETRLIQEDIKKCLKKLWKN